MLANFGLLAGSVWAASAAYLFQPGDLIEVWVGQQPSLNRQVIVRPDGRISLPLVGHLQAEGLSPEQLETSLKERLQTYFKDNLQLTVMLSPNPNQEPPMIYVAGDVDQPGAYRFRPGMTLLHAVSVAGGALQPSAEDLRDQLATQRELEALQRQAGNMALRQARLQAELDNQKQLTVPPSLMQDRHPENAMPQEQSLFHMRTENHAMQVDATTRLRDAANKEIASLTAQIAGTDGQIELMTTRLDNMKSLVSRGLAVDSRLLDLEISLGDLRRTKYQLQSELSRAESSAIQSAASLPNFENQRRIDLLSDLQQTQRDLTELNARIELAEGTSSTLGTLGSSEGGTSSIREPVSYDVLRTTNGKVERVPANELTQVQPGDLVRVTSPSGARRTTRARRSSDRDLESNRPSTRRP